MDMIERPPYWELTFPDKELITEAKELYRQHMEMKAQEPCPYDRFIPSEEETEGWIGVLAELDQNRQFVIKLNLTHTSHDYLTSKGRADWPNLCTRQIEEKCSARAFDPEPHWVFAIHEETIQKGYDTFVFAIYVPHKNRLWRLGWLPRETLLAKPVVEAGEEIHPHLNSRSKNGNRVIELRELLPLNALYRILLALKDIHLVPKAQQDAWLFLQ